MPVPVSQRITLLILEGCTSGETRVVRVHARSSARLLGALSAARLEPQPRAVLETYAGTLAYGVDGTANGIDMCW